MYRVRRWSVRHARLFERLYEIFEGTLVRLDPLLSGIGYARLEKPAAMVERVVKGFFFDCHMCGQCVLGSTGMLQGHSSWLREVRAKVHQRSGVQGVVT